MTSQENNVEQQARVRWDRAFDEARRNGEPVRRAVVAADEAAAVFRRFCAAMAAVEQMEDRVN